MDSSPDFLHRHVERLGKAVHRLGIACNYGIDPDGFRGALEAGVNYIFWTPFRTKGVTPILQEQFRKDRDRYILASGPLNGFFRGGVRRSAEKYLRLLGTDYIDIFQLFWLGVGSAVTKGTTDELLKLKQEGKIRSIGCSIHNRVRAGKLAQDSAFDQFMIRYNAAHPGAERDIFPHLQERKPMITAYTATSWRKLMKRPRGWDGPVMTAADCYRFCLSSQHVDVVLTGPANQQQMIDNLKGIEKGALTADEASWMREFGAAVHG